MSTTKFFAFIFAVCAFLIGTANAEIRNYFSAKYGPAWSTGPHGIWANNEFGKRTGWDVGLEAGYIIDKRVVLGFASDFQWHYATQSIDTGTLSGGTILRKILRDERSFMFPVGGFLIIDPMPNWAIHPSAHLQVGYNSLVFYRREEGQGQGKALYFLGFLLRAGVDATVNLSDNAGLFGGVYGQWADLYRGENITRSMNGWGIRAGLKVIY